MSADTKDLSDIAKKSNCPKELLDIHNSLIKEIQNRESLEMEERLKKELQDEEKALKLIEKNKKNMDNTRELNKLIQQKTVKIQNLNAQLKTTTQKNSRDRRTQGRDVDVKLETYVKKCQQKLVDFFSPPSSLDNGRITNEPTSGTMASVAPKEKPKEENEESLRKIVLETFDKYSKEFFEAFLNEQDNRDSSTPDPLQQIMDKIYTDIWHKYCEKHKTDPSFEKSIKEQAQHMFQKIKA